MPREVGRNQDVVREGDRPTESTLLLEGYTIRHQVLSQGGHQITSIHVPGDFVDLHGLTIRKLDHTITTVTRVKVATVPHTTLRKITETHRISRGCFGC